VNFTSYSEELADLAVDLVNTYGWVSGDETLHTVDDLRSFLADREGGPIPEPPDPVEADLEPVRSLRAALHEVFASRDTRGAVDALNRILAGSRVTPVLSERGGNPQLHFQPATDGFGDWMAVVTAMGLATVIAEEGLERLGVCSAHSCRDAFIDTSRNRSRRHCSDGCRSRENVAAFRRRQRAAD
jgi:predicted RNA-binding Zn ribbon-like protein